MKAMVEGVIIEPLKQIIDERGKVMHMLRADSPLFKRFGEIYFSMVSSGVVKAWKKHKLMTQHLAVPVGRIKLVLYDCREKSPTFGQIDSLEIGEHHYCLVRIPPLLWYGFQGLSSIPALIANCTDLAHDPLEVERLESLDKAIPYKWIIDD